MISSFYINMSNAVDRRVGFEDRLLNVKLPFQVNRFEAMKPTINNSNLTNGELGCLMSHHEVAKTSEKFSKVFVFEDDSIITNSFKRIVPSLISIDTSSLDVVFLNGGLSPISIDLFRRYKSIKNVLGDIYSDDFNEFKLLPADQFYLHGTSAYMLTASGIERLKKLCDVEISKPAANPIDHIFRNGLIGGEIRGAVIFPFVTGIDKNAETQMEGRFYNSDAEINDALANLFVSDKDLISNLEPYAFEMLHKRKFDRESFIFSQILYGRLSVD